ncbi:MAG: hypothetical protein RIC14_13365 [Filomicrobium sp.]
MRHGKWFIALVFSILIGVSSYSIAVSAQGAGDDIQQFALKEEQITNLVAAQPDLAKVAKRLEGMPDDAEVSVQKELDAIATKHGFKNFNELDQVSANVQLILDGLNPETGEYLDPIADMKQELAEVQGDAAMPENEKKELVEEINEAIATMPKLEFTENIALVKKHHKMILKALDAGAEEK